MTKPGESADKKNYNRSPRQEGLETQTHSREGVWGSRFADKVAPQPEAGGTVKM